jgi:hypothetical protein
LVVCTSDGSHKPIDQLEHALKHIEQHTPALNLPRLILVPFRQIQHLLHLHVELVQNVKIHQAQQDQERGADRRPDYPADGAEAVEARRYRRSSSRYDDRCDNDNAGTVRASLDLIDRNGTYVECPREKNVPTVTGCWPVASNLRVIKSIAWII